jgi:DNA-binding NarL/FixJ family response regulator
MYYRNGLVGLLEDSGLDVVADVASGQAALASVRRHHPDVVIMDLSMPGMGGVEATRRLIEEDSDCRVVMLTVSREEVDVLEAMMAGARGFVLKDGPVGDVVQAVTNAAKGHAYFSAAIAPRLLRHTEAIRKRAAGPNRLSDREVEVVSRIAAGAAPGAIADELGVLEPAVHRVVASVLVKLQAQSRGEIAVRAIRDRIV